MADSQIDPAEALIVVTGLEPFLHHRSRDLGSAIVRSEKLPETIEAKIYRFMNRDEREAPVDLPAFDFDETVKLIDATPDPDAIEKTLAAFGNQHNLALAVGTQVTRMHDYIRQQVPRRVHVGLDGPEPLPPSPSEGYRFRRCWRLAVEPLSLFDELQEYALSRGQVDCFQAMFPTTWASLWPTVQECMVRSNKKLPRQKQTLLRVLCKHEAQSLQLAQALAPIYAQEQQAQAAKEAQRSTKAPAQDAESTPVQRLDAAS